MTTKTRTEDQAPAEDQAPDARDAEIARLRAELGQRDADDREAAEAALRPKPARPTHLQLFADGTRVRTAAPAATHHTGDDGIAYPLVSVFELRGEV